MLTADARPKELDVRLTLAEGVDIPELAKVANRRLNILLIPAKDRPVVETNPRLVTKMAPLQLPRLLPFREKEIKGLEPEWATSNGRLSRDPVQKKDRQRGLAEVCDPIISTLPPESGRQTA